MTWIYHPWVIGIGAGILSGIVVMLISRYLLGKRENREYIQKVIGANREVIYAIRPGISEGMIPTRDVVNALVAATARKYGVSASDLYDTTKIAEELTKEIMDSSFISSAKKTDYCAQLDGLIKEYPPPIPATVSTPPSVPEIPSLLLSEYRRRTTTVISMMAGMLTMVMTLFVAFREISDRSLPEPLGLMLPALVVITSIVVTMLAYMLSRKRLDRRRMEISMSHREKDKRGGKEESGDPETG
jgi:hypothetical protein